MLATIADLMDITGESYADDQVWKLNTLLGIASREIQVQVGRKLERQMLVWQPPFRYRYKIQEPINPVIESVRDASGNDIYYTFNGEFIYLANPGLVNAFEINITNPWFLENSRVTITYTAGYVIVPEDVKAICCQMALRAYGANPLKSGMTQEAITNYSYQQGQAAAAGAIGMLPIEKDALRRYKRYGVAISMAGD